MKKKEWKDIPLPLKKKKKKTEGKIISATFSMIRLEESERIYLRDESH